MQQSLPPQPRAQSLGPNLVLGEPCWTMFFCNLFSAEQLSTHRVSSDPIDPNPSSRGSVSRSPRGGIHCVPWCTPKKIYIHLEKHVVSTAFMFHGFKENQENTFIHPKKAPYVIPFLGRWESPSAGWQPQVWGTSCFHLCSSQLLLPAFHVPGCQKSTIILGVITRCGGRVHNFAPKHGMVYECLLIPSRSLKFVE